MKKPASVSRGKKLRLTILPYDGDVEAEQRVRAIIELAITIGRREGLIGSHIPNMPNVSNSIRSKEGG